MTETDQERAADLRAAAEQAAAAPRLSQRQSDHLRALLRAIVTPEVIEAARAASDEPSP